MSEGRKYKRSMRNDARTQKRIYEDRVAKIKVAIDKGLTKIEDIAEATGIEKVSIKSIFQKNRELYAEYAISRKILVDSAADSMQSIVEDKNHPQHFQAIKYVLQNYKSDLDTVLDSHDDSEISIEGNFGGGGGNPARITFGSKKAK